MPDRDEAEKIRRAKREIQSGLFLLTGAVLAFGDPAHFLMWMSVGLISRAIWLDVQRWKERD